MAVQRLSNLVDRIIRTFIIPLRLHMVRGRPVGHAGAAAEALDGAPASGGWACGVSHRLLPSHTIDRKHGHQEAAQSPSDRSIHPPHPFPSSAQLSSPAAIGVGPDEAQALVSVVGHQVARTDAQHDGRRPIVPHRACPRSRELMVWFGFDPSHRCVQPPCCKKQS